MGHFRMTGDPSGGRIRGRGGQWAVVVVTGVMIFRVFLSLAVAHLFHADELEVTDPSVTRPDPSSRIIFGDDVDNVSLL